MSSHYKVPATGSPELIEKLADREAIEIYLETKSIRKSDQYTESIICNSIIIKTDIIAIKITGDIIDLEWKFEAYPLSIEKYTLSTEEYSGHFLINHSKEKQINFVTCRDYIYDEDNKNINAYADVDMGLMIKVATEMVFIMSGNPFAGDLLITNSKRLIKTLLKKCGQVNDEQI